MNSYQASLPRAAITIAAVAMTALTLGLSILPAELGERQQASATDLSRSNLPAVEVAARDGAPIVVYGFREQETGLRKVHMPHVTPPAEAAELIPRFSGCPHPQAGTGSVKGRARCVRPFAFMG